MARYPLAVTLIVAAVANTSTATLVDLDFATLPSSQGWTYSSSGNQVGVLETATFSVDGVKLVSDTMGDPYASGVSGDSRYELSGAAFTPATATDWTLEVTAKITDSQEDGTSYGFAFAARVGGQRFQVGFSTTALSFDDNFPTLIPFASNALHTYRVETNVSLGTYDFLVDNVPFHSGLLTTPGEPDSLRLGDFTGTANARAEVTQFTFLIPEPTAVPEPSGFLCVGLVGLGVLSWKKRKTARQKERVHPAHSKPKSTNA